MTAPAEKPDNFGEEPPAERPFRALRGGTASGTGAALGTKISAGELDRRTAVLKRFRELLKTQRDRFQAYLESLDRQKEAIEGGRTEEVVSHVDLEEQIVADIFSIQKVIDPLEEMYRTLSPAGTGFMSPEPGEDEGVPGLKSALETLKTEAAARSERNKELLSRRMTGLKAEITALRANNPYRASRSIYAGAGTASVIDLRG
jgi:hypothetical protein